MMRSDSNPTAMTLRPNFLLVPALLVMATLPSATLGQPLDLHQAVLSTIEQMKRGQWQDALDLSEKIVKQHGVGAMQQWGPEFGTVYYRKGLCELKLQRWAAAMQSFAICHKEFPNAKGAISTNEFEIKALLYWGMAAMRKQEWQQALDLLHQFGKNYDLSRDGRFDRGQYLLDLATCHYHLGQIEKGNTAFEYAMERR